mmetsp:Transcript_39656/g.51136  ORF Transcript_39656/g.51136 Transcript_39656/m.51136 type:complete len:1011 (-) Transcript_39656:146-3178(-)
MGSGSSGMFGSKDGEQLNSIVNNVILDETMCSMAEDEGVDFTPILIPKSDDSRYLIMNAIKGMFLFESLNSRELNDLIDIFAPKSCNEGDTIIEQGDTGDFMYVVDSGRFDVFQKGPGKIGECKKGDSFGELSLLYNAERSATITCTQKASLWALDRKSFKHYRKSNVQRASKYILDILANVPLFKDLNFFELVRVQEVSREERRIEGEVVIKKGDIGNTFYIILEGMVVCSDVDYIDERHSNKEDEQQKHNDKSRSNVSVNSDDSVTSASSTKKSPARRGSGGLFPMGNIRLKAGEWFGEIALLTGSMRTANFIAETPLHLLAFDRDVFELVLGNLRDLIERVSNNRMLYRLPFIEKLPQEKRDYAINMFSVETYQEGETIAHCGDVNPRMIVIKTGQAYVWLQDDDNNKTNQNQSASSHVASKSRMQLLSVDELSTDMINAELQQENQRKNRMSRTNRFSSDSRFINDSGNARRDRLSSSDGMPSFEVVEPDEPPPLIRPEPVGPPPDLSSSPVLREHVSHNLLSSPKNKAFRTRRCNEIYEGSLDSFSLPSITGSFHRSEMGKKEAKWRRSVHMTVNIQQKIHPKIGDPGRSISDSLDSQALGSLDSNIDESTLLDVGDFVGDAPMLNNTPMNCTVIAKTNLTCFVLAQTDLHSLLYEKGNDDNAEQEMSKFVLATRSFHNATSFVETDHDKRKDIVWDNLRNLGDVGHGTFGTVYVLEDVVDGDKYALKLIDIAGKKNMKKHEFRIKSEIEVLSQLSSPYISKFYSHAVRNTCYFLLMEFVSSGDMKDLIYPIDPKKRFIQRKKILDGEMAGMPHQAAKFYIAAIALPLVYLHRRGIAYRDLKPENIVIDRVGYPKLIDFGLSKRIDETAGKTFTLCGTAEYMAPETILGDGHNQAVDWWALGVLLYEMIVGITPYIKRGVPREQQDQMDIFERIITTRLDYPEKMELSCRSLIHSLLQPKAVFRMGCGRRGNKEFEDHKWFREEMDWVAMNLRQMRPPWTPPPCP